MRRRSLKLIIPLVAAGLLVAGCGGDGDSGASGSNASGGDAVAILKSIDRNSDVGKAAKFGLTLGVDLEGTLKDPQLAAFVGEEPISVSLKGTTSGDASKVDMTYDAKLGKLALDGGLRVVDNKGFVGLNDKWYALPADSFEGTTASIADQKKLMDALGDLSELVDEPQVVGAEDIEGVATDHVRGKADIPAMIAAFGRVAQTVDTGDLGIGTEQISEATAQVEKYLKDTTIDVWVAQDSKRVVRLAGTVDIVLDGDAKDETGLDGVKVNFDFTGTPLDKDPDVEAPDNPGTEEELGQALLPLLFGAIGGAPTP